MCTRYIIFAGKKVWIEHIIELYMGEYLAACRAEIVSQQGMWQLNCESVLTPATWLKSL